MDKAAKTARLIAALDHVKALRGMNNVTWMTLCKKMAEIDPDWFMEWQLKVMSMDSAITETMRRAICESEQ